MTKKQIKLPTPKGINFHYNKKASIWLIKLGKEEVTMRQEELFNLALFAANEEELADLESIKDRDLSCYVRQHTIELSKNMKKGEKVVARCETNVPTLVEKHWVAKLEQKLKDEMVVKVL